MKKFLVSILALAMVLSIGSVTAFAGTLPTGQGDESVTGSNPTSDTVPVYGYIGEDANITDPNPTSPTTPPTVTPTGTAINVTVPTKIIWASFASSGTVASPSYYIQNNSTSVDLDVTLVSFTATGTDNTAVDSSLVLNLTGTQMAQAGVMSSGTGYAPATPTAYATTFARATSATTPTTWNFAIGGTYTGSYSAAKNPTYDMILRFSIH